jgi:serine protease
MNAALRFSLFACLASTLSFTRAQHTPEPNVIPGDILVMLERNTKPEALVHDLATIQGEASGLRIVRLVSEPMSTWLLHFDNAAIPQQSVLNAVKRHDGVLLAQNNHIVTDRAVPNDDEYGDQWHHQNIDSEGAWDLSTGGVTASGDTIVVCIIENADLPHPDLIGNAWFNHHEIANDNIDNDGNGYIDDFRGWNPGGNDDDVYGGGHGTSVAGMIGAKGNNSSQVVGANWNVKMMVVTRNGIGDAEVVESYTYPWMMRRLYNESGGAEGAFVVATNASWGIDFEDAVDHPIWCAVYDSLGTVGILSQPSHRYR